MNGEKKESVGPALRGVTFGYARKCRNQEWVRRLYSYGFDAAGAPESTKKKMLKMTKRSRYVIENKQKWSKNEPKTNPKRTQNEPIFWPNEPDFQANKASFRANEAVFQVIQPILEAREADTKRSVKSET